MTVTSATGTVALAALSGLFWPAPLCSNGSPSAQRGRKKRKMRRREKDEEDEIVATVP